LPVRQRHGSHKGELFWRDATHSRILDLLHNPRYAGAFFYGRCKQRRRLDGARSYEKLPRDQWLACKAVCRGPCVVGDREWPGLAARDVTCRVKWPGCGASPGHATSEVAR